MLKKILNILKKAYLSEINKILDKVTLRHGDIRYKKNCSYE